MHGTIHPGSSGYENDGSTLLYHYRARYYSPILRRFISQDPIGFAGGINWYAYVENSPVNYVDPLGLLCVLSQSSGLLVCQDDETGEEYLNTTTYSGTGKGRDNPAMQHVRDVGPIPRGYWTIGPIIKSGGKMGPYVRFLKPHPDNDVWNMNRDKDTFFIHGDSTNPDRFGDASTGCVIVGDRDMRKLIPPGELLWVIE